LKTDRDHKASRQFRKDKKDKRSSAERFASAAFCHANRLPKQGNDFEQINAFKRNVANRPLQAMLDELYEL
jgi:uncharacterized protein YozE (UPF0346 family)